MGLGATRLLNAPKAVFKGFAGRRHLPRLKGVVSENGK